jgi:hypothetical protein
MLITSPPLDERNLLTENFLKQGIHGNDAVLHITTRLRGIASQLVEGKPESFFLMLCNPWADNMVSDQPNVLKIKGVEDLTQLSISLESFLRDIMEKGDSLRRVLLDIVSDALLTNEIRVVRRWLMDLLAMFKHRNVTTLTTLDPDMHSRDEARTIIDLFDGHMDITERNVDDDPKKILTVKRLYNKKYLERDMVLKRETLTQHMRTRTRNS